MIFNSALTERVADLGKFKYRSQHCYVLQNKIQNVMCCNSYELARVRKSRVGCRHVHAHFAYYLNK